MDLTNYVLWLPIIVTMATSTWWAYAGREHPYFITIEVLIGATSALWWALIAVNTKSNQTLFIYGFIWDMAYVALSIIVPKYMFNTDIKPWTIFWIIAATLCLVMAKVTTGESQ